MPSYEAPLSIVDQIMPGAPIAMWLVFATEDPDGAVMSIQRGLDLTVSQLPFLSGQVYDDPRGSYRAKISWSDESPKVPFEEVPGPDLPDYVTLASKGMALHTLGFDFEPQSLKAAYVSDRKPALIASHTKIKGGLIMLIAPHHHLVDGGGQALLYNLLACNTKGLTDNPFKIDPQEPISRVDQLTKAFDSSMRAAGGDIRKLSTQLQPFIADKAGVVNVPVANTGKLFRFSVRRLEKLRKALQPYVVAKFSLNTMLTALLWALTSEIRIRRLKSANPDFRPEVCESILCMMINFRRQFHKLSLLNENTWIGNLSLPDRPRVSLSSFSKESFELQLDSLPSGPGKKDRQTDSCLHFLCPGIVPSLIDTISGSISTISAAEMAAAFTDTANEATGAPAFDYRQLRDMSTIFNGLNFTCTNWGALDFLPDFGARLGRPKYARAGGMGGYEGGCVMLPRHRTDDCAPELLDRFEMLMTLREDDMQELVQNEIVQSMLSEPPV